MSATALLISLVVALIATFVYAAISGAWTSRALAAMYFYALCILLLPALVRG